MTDQTMSSQSALATCAVRWLRSDEEAAWDSFVIQHPHGLIYHRASWKRVLDQAFPHIRGRFLALCHTETGAIVAGLPMYTVKSWLLGNRVVSLPYASFCDPLISGIEQFNQLFPHMQDVYRQTSARVLEVRTRKTAPDFAMSSLAPAFTYKHHFLQLDKDPEALFRSFSKTSIRQMVAKAQKAEVRVVEAESKNSVSICHDIVARTRRRLCLPPLPFSFFNAMQSYLWPQQMKMFLALHHEKPVGCLIVLISGDLWISEYSGNTDDAINGVNQLLYWETIQRACAAGAKTFSFGRTALSNEGLLSYKRRWATTEEDLVDFVFPSDIVSSPSLLERADRESTVQYRVLKSVLASAPLPVCEMIGRFCYRHLG